MIKRCLIILSLLIGLLCANTNENAMISVPRAELIRIVAEAKKNAFKAMYYDDLRVNMEFHFYKLNTVKLETSKGEQFTHTYSIYQKPSPYNDETSPLIFTFEFKTSNNNTEISQPRFDITYVWVGLGGFTAGLLTGFILVIATK